MDKIKFILIAFLIFVTFVITIACKKFFKEDEILPTNEKALVLKFSNGEKVYVRAKVWGVSGNHQEIVFSENPITIPNKDKDYIFYTDEVLYKIDKNSLSIFAPQSGKNIPKLLFSNIEVIFKGLKNSAEISDYSMNYKKYGLEKISVLK